MSQTPTAAVLSTAAEEVLETMFFLCSGGEGAACETAGSERISAALDFHGTRSGTVCVSVSLATARNMAQGFLGIEAGAISESQVAEVVRELANMVSGSVLSRLEPEGRFELAAPNIIGTAQPGAAADAQPVAACRLNLDDGFASISLYMRDAT